MDCMRGSGRFLAPSLRLPTTALLLGLLLLSLPGGGTGSSSAWAYVPPWIADPGGEHALDGDAKSGTPDVPAVDPSLAEGRDETDVLRYELSLFPNFETESLVGTVSITFESRVEGLQRIDLDLYDGLDVDAVRFGGQDLVFTHAQDVLRIFLPEPLDLGRTSTISVQYRGTPEPAGFMGFQFLESAQGARTLSTLSQPYFARSWWPCKDTPTDKAQLQLYVMVPAGMFAASNGALVGQQPLGSHTLYTWVETYPISTYNVSLAVADYVSWSEDYRGPDQQKLTLEYHVFPEDEEAARYDFGRTAEILDYYVELFGQYPFITEKYGMAEFVFVGAMEHQTMASYGQFFLTGDRFYERIIGHELAHQWWGNAMTLTDWSDLWIHEGLATLSEGLWLEYAEGREAYHSFLRSRSNNCCGFRGPISPPLELFNSTVYNKSAWMLHMLRRMVGDQDFFQALRDLAARPELQYGSIDTEVFVQQFESSTGIALGWFFDQWLLRTGRPTLAADWSAEPVGDRYRVEILLDQTGEGDPWIFPLDLRVHTTDGAQDLRTWVTSGQHRLTTFVDAVPTDLEIDPDQSLLWFEDESGTVTAAPMPYGGTRLLPNVPNPFNPRTRLRFELPRSSSVELRILDARGRVVEVLRPGTLGAGLHELPWDGTDLRGSPVASGVYQVQLRQLDGTGRHTAVRPITLIR